MIADFNLPIPAESSIFKALPEGGVLFSTASEVYFGVNGVGARVWQLLPPICARFEELVGRLAQEYTDVSVDMIRADAKRFIDQLVANGLAIAAAGAQTDPQPRS